MINPYEIIAALITYNWEPLRRLRLSSSGIRVGWDTAGDATAGADDESSLIIFSSSAATS